jgi:hypothetical protein
LQIKLANSLSDARRSASKQPKIVMNQASIEHQESVILDGSDIPIKTKRQQDLSPNFFDEQVVNYSLIFFFFLYNF